MRNDVAAFDMSDGMALQPDPMARQTKPLTSLRAASPRRFPEHRHGPPFEECKQQFPGVITNELMPYNYAAEPIDFPGFQLVWVDEIGKFAIVRFFTDVSGSLVMTPIRYSDDELIARAQLALCHRSLATALTRSRSFRSIATTSPI